MKSARSILALSLSLAFASAYAAKPPKNVILMISDGTGYNSFLAAAMYEGRVGKLVFNSPEWAHCGVATYPLNLSSKPLSAGKQDPKIVYDPAKAWADQAWLKGTATDSAAAATAMGTGVKTFNNSIGWSDLGKPLLNVHQQMKALGKATGVVTSVPWTHATPAGMVAHNPKRGDYQGIAKEMVYKSGMDVIMGAGNPLFDGDGEPVEKLEKAGYVGWPTFLDLLNGRTSYRFIQNKTDFQALAAGRLDMQGKRRVLGTATTSDTLQQGRKTKDWNRDGKVDDKDTKVAPAYGDPFVQSVPALETMAQGALNVLSQNPKGFFLMVEGGAVDWANHANQPGRMIEEERAFLRTVEMVSQWVKKHGGWSQNLVIVTADHETGFLWGPDSATEPFTPMVDNGKGRMPGLAFNYGSHTNSLVPLWARGPGANRIAELAKKRDPRRGRYMENTDIFRLMTGE
jgi:alkaline phosphatase